MPERLSRSEESKRKRDYWKRHIDSWQASGLSQVKYCRQNDLKDHLFVYWKKRIVKPEAAAKFISLNLGSVSEKRATQPACPLRLVVSDRFAIEVNPGFDPHLLRQLIIAIRGVQ
jgi:hypothetical protein